ncbi:MAG: aminotransferase class IV [Phycisphaeraceae bacterium]|nr:aminotransferase class IV [Phycisphaeraceae bacterium]
MATVWFNGRIVPAHEARVSAFDAGFTHAVGLFETMLGGNGTSGPWAAQLSDHMLRLRDSASDLGLADHINTTALGDAVLETIEASGLDLARVRLTFTGGDLNLLSRTWDKARNAPNAAEDPDAASCEPASTGIDPTVLILVQEATAYPAEMFERGVAVTIADMRANPLDPLAGHKTLNYWGRLRELRAAGSKGAAEALVMQVTNHLAGGCVSNALIVKGDAVITPLARGEEARATMPSPVLPGTVRAWALEWAEERGMTVDRRLVTIEDMLGADEVLLTNSSWGVLPVVKIEREAIADATPGRVAGQLRRAWEEKILEEAGM